jgi:hypothetical protein
VRTCSLTTPSLTPRWRACRVGGQAGGCSSCVARLPRSSVHIYCTFAPRDFCLACDFTPTCLSRMRDTCEWGVVPRGAHVFARHSLTP